MSSKSVISPKTVGGASPGNVQYEDDSTIPDFIYGGPFISGKKTQFFDTVTPINLHLQGIFKKSFAYSSLIERLPIILTKTIDYLSRESRKIKSAHGANDEDIKGLIQYITKLKNDIITNKKYDLLTVDTPEAKRWNEWIQAAENSYYFTNIWVFSECYAYRRLREGCELSKGLKDFDPFDEQKEQAFKSNIELMCLVADRLVTMLPADDKEQRKSDFMTLLKICLWANKCDLSLTMGEDVSMSGNGRTGVSPPLVDPFQMVVDFKDKLLVDDTAKIADFVVTRAENMAKTVEPPPSESSAEAEKPSIIFDIVCDNTGYELYSDLCLAHYLISQKIVQKVRFNVKRIPWFVSDVTPRDFQYTIEQCMNATYRREIPSQSKDGEESTSRVVDTQNLRILAQQWQQFVEDGTFVVLCDDFWTSPHVYKDMKKYDPELYRRLQSAIAVLFKGDLNYRKLLADKNWNSVTTFEDALQGFHPAPVITLRTLKADLICGLPKGLYEQLNNVDDKWLLTGDYGVIQFCPKAEPLKEG